MIKEYFEVVCYSWLALALVVHVVMFFVKAPFGRHTSSRWGVMINNKWGWFFMEIPSLLIMLYFLMSSVFATESKVWILFVFWIFHYLNRTVIYPLRIKPTEKKMPVFILANGILFNCTNASLNGYYLGALAAQENYSQGWLTSLNFMFGIILFVGGLAINWKADGMLIGLRKTGETGYKIPRGFLFEYVSSPNLLGEILEWSGFALMAWNLPAFTFMVWTFANLVPRAKNHHDWYLKNFPDYPKNRKVIFPFIF